MNISLVIQCLILKALKNSTLPLKQETIENYIISKIKGVRSDESLKVKILKQLNLFCKNNCLNMDKNGCYYVESSSQESRDQTTAENVSNTDCGELLTSVVNNSEEKTKASHTLDPNKRAPGDLSQDSMSGDEFELPCKRLHTNTKLVKFDKTPVNLPEVRKCCINVTAGENDGEEHCFMTKIMKTEEKKHICVLPDNGLKAYEILSVVCPRTNVCCGSLIFVPFDLRNCPSPETNFASDSDECEPPSKKARFENVNESDVLTNVKLKPKMDGDFTSNENYFTSDNAPQTMFPNPDELKPPKYADSHDNTNAGKPVKRAKKRKLNFIQRKNAH